VKISPSFYEFCALFVVKTIKNEQTTRIFNYETREMPRKGEKMQGLATKEHKKAQKREARRILTG